MTVRIVEGRIRVDDLPSGRWRLVEPVTLDLGTNEPELVAWATPHPDQPLQIWESGPPSMPTTRIRVPAGLATDFSSIPVVGQLVMGPKDRYRLAGLCHDALFRWQAPRAPSDRVWWLIATAGERRVGPVRGWLGWAALRLFGGRAYRQYRRTS
jgi:hypothetical protein